MLGANDIHITLFFYLMSYISKTLNVKDNIYPLVWWLKLISSVKIQSMWNLCRLCTASLASTVLAGFSPTSPLQCCSVPHWMWVDGGQLGAGKGAYTWSYAVMWSSVPFESTLLPPACIFNDALQKVDQRN